MTTHIYHLVDPNDRLVRYVGKTTTPAARLRGHIKDAEAGDNTEKKRWIRGLLARGQQPIMVTVASFPDDHSARIRESAECRKHLATIYNIHDPAKGAKDLKPTGKKAKK